MNNNHISTIKKILLTFNEEHLYAPLQELFTLKGHQTRIIHGAHERGKDLIATKPGDYNLLISVKKGDINKDRWDEEILSSVLQMITRSINYSGVDENLERKVLLIFTGDLTPALASIIDDFNLWAEEHNSCKLDVWDIERLAAEFYDNLLQIDVVGSVESVDYYNDINRIILQISPSTYPSNLMVEFIDKNYWIKFERISKSNMINIVLLYILKKSQKENNIYAFFYFAEYSLIKL